MHHIAIIGAGPYGMAACAHLRAASAEVHVFGEAMEFWQLQMPQGMWLRSSWEASSIADPQRSWSLDRYQDRLAAPLATPVLLKDFVAYGQWFQGHAVPKLDRRRVARVEASNPGFRLRLADGEALEVERLVVAGGIGAFAYRPPEFAELPSSLASHSSEHSDLGRFAGQRVTVIGGGQSALESAALLREGNADVDVLVRAPLVRWLGRGRWLREQPKPIRHLFYPPTDVGPPVLNQIVARPGLFRRLPHRLQQRIAYRSIRPAAKDWVKPRLAGVPITVGRSVTQAEAAGKKVRLTLDDGSVRCVDHVLLATGYRVDVSRYSFLAPELARSIDSWNGYPRLSSGFESSVPRLHFLGAPAAWSFGPLMRFVSGTRYAARALTRCVVTAQR
jgi:lysine/ornithine N-monooxygenase